MDSVLLHNLRKIITNDDLLKLTELGYFRSNPIPFFWFGVMEKEKYWNITRFAFYKINNIVNHNSKLVPAHQQQLFDYLSMEIVPSLAFNQQHSYFVNQFGNSFEDGFVEGLKIINPKELIPQYMSELVSVNPLQYRQIQTNYINPKRIVDMRPFYDMVYILPV